MGGALILVGVFGAAQGVRGELRLKSYTGEPRAIGAYGPLTSADGGRAFTLTSLRPLKGDMLVVRVAGVDSREAAARLTNVELYLARDRLPPPDEGEVYHADLIGLRAEGEDGRALGRVARIENHGAGDILVVERDVPGGALLVPFARGFVPVVDVAAGRLVVAAGALGGDDGADAPGPDGR